MAYQNLRFSWHGIHAADVNAAQDFFGAVMGWNFVKVPMGEHTATLAEVDGCTFAHVDGLYEGMQPHCSSYLRVEDVDASAKACAEAGGTVVYEPMDIPPGRIAGIMSPSGSLFHLYRESDDSDTNHPSAVVWVELHSGDVAKDLPFLKAAFGYDSSIMPMPEGDYHLLKEGEGDAAFGAFQSDWFDGASAWLAWFRTDDVDACHTRVTDAGGTPRGEVMNYPGVGRMFMATSPQGVVFGVIQPERR